MAAPTAAEAAAMRDAWDKAVNETKRQATSPALFRALERTVALAWEDGFFVVGFPAMDGQQAAQLNTGQNQLLIERVLRSMTNTPDLRFRVVEGTSYTDWQHARQRDLAAETNRVQQVQKKAAEATGYGSWDDVYDRVSRLWANMEFRNIATGRGRYIAQALDLVSEAMDALYPTDEKVPEPIERGLSRVLERVASMTSSDPAVIAYLLFERRKK